MKKYFFVVFAFVFIFFSAQSGNPKKVKPRGNIVILDTVNQGIRNIYTWDNVIKTGDSTGYFNIWCIQMRGNDTIFDQPAINDRNLYVSEADFITNLKKNNQNFKKSLKSVLKSKKGRHPTKNPQWD